MDTGQHFQTMYRDGMRKLTKTENLAPVSKFAFKSISLIVLFPFSICIIPVMYYLITNIGECIYKLISLS